MGQPPAGAGGDLTVPSNTSTAMGTRCGEFFAYLRILFRRYNAWDDKHGDPVMKQGGGGGRGAGGADAVVSQPQIAAPAAAGRRCRCRRRGRGRGCSALRQAPAARERDCYRRCRQCRVRRRWRRH